jgi:uncharacterized protein
MNPYIVQLNDIIPHLFSGESSGHDINHLVRVLNIATTINRLEGGDADVVSVAAYLHDIHRLVEKQTKTYCSPKDSLPKIKEILEQISFPENKTDMVLHCIEFHEEYQFSQAGVTVEDIETLILQDADNLDAIGAIGVGRTFAYGGSKGLPMWIVDRSLNRETYDESQPDPDTISHFYSKLLKLKSNMNTVTGKEMAQKRHEFMELFLDHFFKEWKGEL